MWTIAKVKAELPDVPLRLNGKVQTARVSGRLNDDATVSVGYSSARRGWIDYHFAWSTIANALNSGRILSVGDDANVCDSCGNIH